MGEAFCIFCKIVSREIPAAVVLEDEEIVAFKDANPKAPVHCLVVPRRHVERVADLGPADAALAGRLVLAATEVARGQGLTDRGYRLVVNNGSDVGQTVSHLHVHVMGGRAMGWPPG